MNIFGRFFMAFALLGLVGAGCFSNQEVVIDMNDDANETVEDSVDTQEAAVNIEEGVYRIDAESSTIAWVGRKPAGQHNGTINISEGALDVGDTVVTGDVVIDMDTIVDLDLEDEEMNATLVEHLKSDDFFAVETYPTAIFTFTQLDAMDGDENLQVTGTLTMKNITNEVTFPAQLIETESGYQLKAQFELDRTKWDVRFGSQTLLGDAINVLIDDMITIGLDIMLVSAE